MVNAIIFISRSPFLDYDMVMPQLGPLYLKSFAEINSHLVDIDDKPDINNVPDLSKYEVIGISTTTPQYYWKNGSKEFAKKLRALYPNKKLIIGGAHAKNYFNELIEDNLFDYIIRGDGEKAFLDILDGKQLPKIILYPQLSSEEMNSFPVPWRDKEYLDKYQYFINGKRATTVLAARYCPMRCKFCEERDSMLTLYTPERLEKELEDIKKAGFEAVMFYDDIFPISEKRTEELCKVIKKQEIIFRCNGHVKIMAKNKKIIELMKNAGCVEICLGIESADQRILDIIDKGNKVEDIFLATKNILDAKIRVVAYLIIGLPGENKESITNTEKYIAEFSDNPKFRFDFTIFYPYRHTYIRENLHEFDLNIELEGSTGAYKQAGGESECCVWTYSLTKEDIINERKRILKEYGKNFRGNVDKNIT